MGRLENPEQVTEALISLKTKPFRYDLELCWRTRCRSRGCDDLHMAAFGTSPSPGSIQYDTQAKLLGLPAGSIVAMLGGRGTGKTQIAQNVIAVDLWNLNHADKWERNAPMYTTAARLFRKIRDSFRKRGEDDPSEGEVMDSFIRPSILVIDEAHDRGETDFENRALPEIIDSRYAALRTTIIISNQDRKAFGASIGPSVISRIHEVGTVVVCDWPSFRSAA